MLLLDMLKDGKLALAKRLIEKGDLSEINHQGKDGISPLHLCILRKWYVMSELLLRHGANLQATAKIMYHEGMTPLHTAALVGDTEIVNLLMIWGADFDAENSDYQTPSQIAHYYRHPEIASLMDRKPAISFVKKPLITFLNPEKATYSIISIEDILAKRFLELQNASPEAEQTRKWLNKHYPKKANVVDFLRYKKKKSLNT